MKYPVLLQSAAEPGNGGNWASCLPTQVKSEGTGAMRTWAVKDANPELFTRDA